jgi:hypothetical protein
MPNDQDYGATGEKNSVQISVSSFRRGRQTKLVMRMHNVCGSEEYSLVGISALSVCTILS